MVKCVLLRYSIIEEYIRWGLWQSQQQKCGIEQNQQQKCGLLGF